MEIAADGRAHAVLELDGGKRFSDKIVPRRKAGRDNNEGRRFTEMSSRTRTRAPLECMILNTDL
jgi:hypothetical protein